MQPLVPLVFHNLPSYIPLLLLVLICVLNSASFKTRAVAFFARAPRRASSQRYNPRRACARVTVVAVCVYPSVTALAASASV